MGVEDALVHDTLCALQAPTGLVRLTEMMAAAGIRTPRGAAFHPPEVKRVLERLLAGSHATRDPQGRVRAAAPHGPARFAEMLRDPLRAKAWFDAWRKLVQFEHSYSLGFQEEEQLARGDAAGDLRRRHARTPGSPGQAGLQLHAFVERCVATCRAASLSTPNSSRGWSPRCARRWPSRCCACISGFAESATRPLEDWLLAQPAKARAALPPTLRCRLAETLLFRGDSAGAHGAVRRHRHRLGGLMRASLAIAQGQWEGGAAQFEAALKLAAAELGRRKNLASPSLAWLYLMALLAQGTPAAWSKARKFAAAEAGKGQADPYGFWGVWLRAIDQRLGDAPKAPQNFRLARARHSGLQSLQYLHHLLLAAWLRVEVTAPQALRAHATQLSQAFRRRPNSHGWRS